MDSKDQSTGRAGRRRDIVISGGTDGMGRALALARAGLGDRVTVLGSNAGKGRQLLEDAAGLGTTGGIEFVRVDLASVSETRSAIRRIGERHDAVDALVLFANRHTPDRTLTPDGLERTFAVYYLSRYLLSHGLSPLLRRSTTPVIVNVAGVGTRAGRLHWDDLQLEHGYGTVAAQLQAGRANDLLGVAYAALPDNPVRYVLYHPGFTRSGDLTPFRAPVRLVLRALSVIAARSVDRAVAPVHGFVETPPDLPLTAIDRGRSLPLDLVTLDPADAARLEQATREILRSVAPEEDTGDG